MKKIQLYPINVYKESFTITNFSRFNELLNDICLQNYDRSVIWSKDCEYLFYRRVSTESKCELVPIQQKHYSSRNSLMPIFSLEKTEEENEQITLCARSEFSLFFHIILSVFLIILIIGGVFWRGALLFIGGELLVQMGFWLPFRKAYSELSDLISEVSK